MGKVGEDQDNFESYQIAIKAFASNTSFDDLPEDDLYFDASVLELKDTNNVELINEEMNKISRKIFRFAVILESQAKVLQMLEDEHKIWYAKKYHELMQDPMVQLAKKQPTAAEKENMLIINNETEYKQYKSKISDEQYKYSLIKRTVSALEGYSYKLHDLQKYRSAAMMKGI